MLFNPVCPGQQPAGGSQGNRFTMPGSVLRANNAATDFALLELIGNLIFQPAISFDGWVRTSQTTANSTYIHHPSGDAKKITLDAGLNVVGANFYEFNLKPGDNGDFGTLECGSSGYPKFYAIRRIIGQQQGGTTQQILCNTPNSQNTDGRFDRSWNGGGTNATRLNNWLGGTNPSNITNTIRASHIMPFAPNNRVEYVCTTYRLFTLNAAVLGTAVTWSVSNPGLFATSGHVSTSGTGTNAPLRAFSAGASGGAVSTFSMTGQGCGQPINVTRQIWVGRTGLPITSPSGTSPFEIGVSQYHTVFLSSAPGAASFIADWSASGAVFRIGGNFPATYATFVGNYVGTGNWQVTTSNVCGTRANFGQYNVTSNCNPRSGIILNYSVQDELVAEISEYIINFGNADNSAEIKGEFILFDQNGVDIKSEEFRGHQHITNVQDMKPGLYILKMKNKDFDLAEKVIIIKQHI